MTKFISRIDVEVDGDIVRAKLFDRQSVQEVAMCRKTAIRAAMQLLEQLDPADEGAEIVPMMRKAAAG